MELRHLRYFAEVVRAGSFRSAAERLQIAQPALWQQVRGLERELGVPLFVRSGRGVRVTASGLRLLERAEDALAGAQRVLALADDLRAGRSGTVVVAAPTPAIGRFLASAIAAFKQTHADVAISLLEYPRQRAESNVSAARDPIEALMAGAADIAIGRRVAGLDGFRLYDVHVVAVGLASEDSGQTARVAQLRHRALLVPPAGSFSRELLELECRASGFEPKMEFESPFPSTLVALAAAGLGVAVVAEDAVDPVATHAAILTDRRGQPLGGETWAHWRWASDPALVAFIGTLRGFAARP